MFEMYESRSMLWKLAWRSVWRRKRRTLITLSSIAFGIALCLFFTGISDGMYGKVTDMAVRMGSGHLVLENPEYRDEQDLDHTLIAKTTMIAALRKDQRIEGLTLRISGPAMFSSSYGTVGGGFDAVVPEVDQSVSLLATNIKEGVYLKNERDLILGIEMARKLKTRLGGKIVLTTQNKNGETVQDLFRVSGIFETQSDMMDGFYAEITLDAAQHLLGLEDNEVNQIGIFLHDRADMTKVKADLEALPELKAVAVVPWQKILRDLADYIKVDNAFNYVFQFLLFLVILAGVLNTVLMSVMERTYEFGVMISIGMKRSLIVALVSIEGFILSTLGISVGGLLGVIENAFFKRYPINFSSTISEMSVGGFFIEPSLRMDLSPFHFFITLAAVFVMVLLAGLYPAFKAGQIEPVDALHSL